MFPEGQTVLKSSKKKGRYSPEEKNGRGWSAEEGLPKVKIEQGKGLSEGRAKKFAGVSEERRKWGVALAVSSMGDRGACGTCAVASRSAIAG